MTTMTLGPALRPSAGSEIPDRVPSRSMSDSAACLLLDSNRRLSTIPATGRGLDNCSRCGDLCGGCLVCPESPGFEPGRVAVARAGAGRISSRSRVTLRPFVRLLFRSP